MDEEQFQQRLSRLGLGRGDVQELFSRSSGPGGQHVNKVSTSVTLKCDKLGIAVTVEDSRSQARNRELARDRFIARIEGARRAAKAAKRAEIERERRRRRPRPRGLKERILKSKKLRSQVKKGRSRPVE